MGKLCKKLISIVLIITLLINSNADVFAGISLYTEQQTLQELKYLVNQTITSDIKIIDEKYIRKAYQKESNFHKLIESLNKQGEKNDYGEVCDGDICAPYYTFMRGVIGALIDFSEGDGDILIEYTREIREAIFLGALASEDIKPMREALKAGVKGAIEACGSKRIVFITDILDGIKDMVKTAKENFNKKYKDRTREGKEIARCEKGLAGLSILSVICEGAKESEETADFIYKVLKKHYTGKYGGLVLMEGIAALTYMDTDYSYSLIERFLTKTSIPGVGEGIEKELSLFLPQGWYDLAEAGISRDYKRGMRYLNMNSERWSYINEEETQKAGLDPKIIASQGKLLLDKEHAYTSYNIVYGNLLTDIGEFIIQSGARGKRLGDKILDSYINSNKVVHLPLMLGLIKGRDASHDITVGLAARKLNRSFYYDTNGGTGKYIAKTSAVKGSGLDSSYKNVMSYEYYKARVGIERFNVIADTFISAIFLGTFILSVPSLMRGLYKLGRLLKLSVKYGGKNVARMVRIVKGSEKAAAEAAKQSSQAKQANQAKAAKAEPKTQAKTEPKTKTETTNQKWDPNTVDLVNKNGNTIETGIYNKGTSEITDVTKVDLSQETVTTTGGGGASGGSISGSVEGALGRVRTRTKRLRTSREVNRQVREMEIETAAAKAKPQKANNIFNKPYSQMNKLQKMIFDTYVSLELGWLGDLKSAIKSSKSLFTTKTGLKTTATSGLTMGIGETPAVEARIMAKAPTEVVTQLKNTSSIFDSPINLFDHTGVNTQIGSTGRAASKMPNTFKISTPRAKPAKPNSFNKFQLFSSYMGLARQQKLNNLKRNLTLYGFTATTGLTALGIINPVIATAITGLLIATNTFSSRNINDSAFGGKKSNARSDTAPDDTNGLTIDQARILNLARKAPLFAVIYSFMATGLSDFVSPAVALAQDTFHISSFKASLLSLAGYLMFLLSVPISKLQTIIGKTNVIKIGAALATVGAALPIFFGMYGNVNSQIVNDSQFYAMAASIALVCLGSTMIETGASSLFAEVSKSNEEITPNLVLGDAIRCIPIALGFVAPFFLDFVGLHWTAVYPIYTALFASALAIISNTKIAEVRHEDSFSLRNTLSLLKNKDIFLLFASMIAYMGAEVAILSMTPVMFAEQGFPVQQAEIIGFITTMLPIIISNFISPPLIRRFSENKVFITSLITTLAGLGLVLTPGEITTYIGLILTGLGYGNVYPLLLGRAQQKDLDNIDSIMGLMLTATASAAFMTPLTAAFAGLTNTTLSYLIPVACATFILAVILRDNYHNRNKKQDGSSPKLNNLSNSENIQDEKIRKNNEDASAQEVGNSANLTGEIPGLENDESNSKLIEEYQPFQIETSKIIDFKLKDLTKSVVLLYGVGGVGSGFITEIPLFGKKQQVIITAGHVVADNPSQKISVYDSNGKFLTFAKVAFYYQYGKDLRNGIFFDYAVLVPENSIDAPSLPLVLDRPFSDFNIFKNLAFPDGIFFHQNYKLVPQVEGVPLNPDIGFFDFLVEPGWGASGSVILAETEPGKYSAIGLLLGVLHDKNKTYGLMHSLGFLKRFIETGDMFPDFMKFLLLNDNRLFDFMDGSSDEFRFSPTVRKTGFSQKELAPVQIKTTSKVEPTSTSYIERNQPLQIETPQIIDSQIEDLKKSIVFLRDVGGYGSGFITEIPFFGVKKQVIITAGHVISDYPSQKISVYDSNGKFLTFADVAFYYDRYKYGKFRGLIFDYAVLIPRDPIDAPSLPLVLDRPFSDFDTVKSLSFPNGKFFHQNYKLVPQLKGFLLNPDIGFFNFLVEPEGGASGGVVLAETSPDIYSAIGIILATFTHESKDYGLIHSLNFLKKFIETGVTVPDLTKPNFPDGMLFNVLNRIRNRFSHTPTVRKTGFSQKDFTPVSSDEPISSQYNNPIIDVNGTDDIKKSVFKLEGYDNSFSGFLGKLPYWISPFGQGIFTAGHGVERFPNKPITVYNNSGEKLTLADVLFYKYQKDREDNYLVDYSILIPRKKIDAEPIDLSFDGLGNYKSFVTYSFPKGEPSSRIRTLSPVRLTYENIDFLQGGAVGGESGSPVIAETEPNKYSVVGMIIASFANKITLVQNLKWFQDFLRGKLTIAKIMKPDISFPSFRYGQQLEIPFELGDGNEDPLFQPTSLKKDDEIIKGSLSKVAKAELVPVEDGLVKARAVWKLLDHQGKVIGYLKYGMVEELNKTKLLHKIITENNLLEKYPLLNIQYPQIIEEDIQSLDKNIFESIEQDFKRIKDDVRYAPIRTQIYFAMTPVDASGFAVTDEILFTRGGGPLAAEKLNNKPITDAEWEQIEDFFKDLNALGFVHEDLKNNLFFKRDKNDKLMITILDFEEFVNLVYNGQDILAIKNYFNIIKPYFMPKIFREIAKLVTNDRSESSQPYIRWALSDNNGKVIGDLVYSTPEKIASIKKLHKIITENNLLKRFDNIEVKYPQVSVENRKSIFDLVKLLNLKDKKLLYEKLFLDNFIRENESIFIMTPIDDNGFRLSDIKLVQQGENFGYVYMNNKPITAAEWNSVFNFIVELNKQGFVLENIYNNLIFKRDKNNKLVVTITDFGLGNTNTNIPEMQMLGNMMYNIGIKDRNYFLDFLYHPQNK